MGQKVAQPVGKETAKNVQPQQTAVAEGQKPKLQGREAALLNLQRTHGNRHVTQGLKGGILQRQCSVCGQESAGGECVECGKTKGRLQRKLRIGASNDPLELEADRVANQVMALSARSVVSNTPPRIQRFIAQPSGQDMEVPASVDRVLSSPGSPLETALKQDMEQRFGHDFSQVRIHTDVAAGRSARDMNADAYTVAHNIVFREGHFVPETHRGRRLVAHELTHVVQQRHTTPVILSIDSPSAIARQVLTVQRKSPHQFPESAMQLQRQHVQTTNTNSGLQRVQAAITANNLQTLITIQQELRQQMLTDPLHPPDDARVGLATARHWMMDQIAAIRDRHQSQIEAARTGGSAGIDGTGTVETLETSMDAECTPYLDALMQGDPQYRYEHFNTDVSEKVFAAVRLHSSRRGVGQIGHRAQAEAEARQHGRLRLPKDSWCGAFAYTQAEQSGGFDPHWVGYMQGEGGIRTALAYGGQMANTWTWVFDHWERLREYHEHRNSLRRYQPIDNSPPPQGIQSGDLVLMDNAFGTNPDHITTAISFDGRFITTVGGNQGTGEAGVSRSGHAFDIQNNPAPNDVTHKDAQGRPILDSQGNRTSIPGRAKNVRIHGIGRWSIVDYEKRLYRVSPTMPAPPSAQELAALG